MRRVRLEIQFSRVESSDVRSQNVDISGASPKSMRGCFVVGSGFWGVLGDDRTFSGQILSLLLTVILSPVIFSTIAD